MTDERPAEPDTHGVLEAVRRDAQCDVQAGHPVGLMFAGHDIKAAARDLAITFAESRVRACAVTWAKGEQPSSAFALELAALARLKTTLVK